MYGGEVSMILGNHHFILVHNCKIVSISLKNIEFSKRALSTNNFLLNNKHYNYNSIFCRNKHTYKCSYSRA